MTVGPGIFKWKIDRPVFVIISSVDSGNATMMVGEACIIYSTFIATKIKSQNQNQKTWLVQTGLRDLLLTINRYYFLRIPNSIFVSPKLSWRATASYF